VWRSVIIITSIQLLDQLGQEPEPSQVTGMALVHCILGKFTLIGQFICTSGTKLSLGTAASKETTVRGARMSGANRAGH
jgi:hypothetical protein